MFCVLMRVKLHEAEDEVLHFQQRKWHICVLSRRVNTSVTIASVAHYVGACVSAIINDGSWTCLNRRTRLAQVIALYADSGSLHASQLYSNKQERNLLASSSPCQCSPRWQEITPSGISRNICSVKAYVGCTAELPLRVAEPVWPKSQLQSSC